MIASTIIDVVSRAPDEAPGQNFRETVDLIVNLRDLDLNDPSKRASESIVLPSGTGQDTRIMVFTIDETALRAEGAIDEVLEPDGLGDFDDDTNVAKSLADKTDSFVAEAGLVQDIGRYLGTMFGPRDKMSTPLQPDDDVVETAGRMKNTVQLRSCSRRTLHTRVSADDMMPDEITENIDVIVRRLEATLERGLPSVNSVCVETTMGPSVEVSV